jgi:hypothetical protein
MDLMDRIERGIDRVIDKGAPIALTAVSILFAVFVLRGFFGG